jgi:hypothetical protein
MEYKALSRGESGSYSVKKVAVKKPEKVRLRASRRLPLKEAHQPTVDAAWGPVYVDVTEFAELEKCIQTPQKPTPSIQRGAELIRSMYQKKR